MHLLCGKPVIQASRPERVMGSVPDLEERIAKLEKQVAMLLEHAGL
jgi:hypothetical protein